MIPMEGRNLTLFGSAVAAAVASIYVLWGPSEKRRPRRRELCPGLVNLGNSCFLNAILQALAPCGSVVSWLSEFVDRQRQLDCTQFLTTALGSVLKVLNNDSVECQTEFAPTSVLDALRAHRWVISSEEQDAHEMLHVLTETLDEEASSFQAVLPLFDAGKLEECNGAEYQSRDCARSRTQGDLPLLPITSSATPLRGLLASQLQCKKCAYKRPVRYDTFDSLSLSIPASHRGALSLDRLLRHYSMAETVEDVECDGCAARSSGLLGKQAPKPKSTFAKKLTIGKLPQCLCIHVQRTVWLDNGMPMKRFDHVAFPEVLNMDQYIYRRQSKRPTTLIPPRDVQARLVGGRIGKNGFNQVNSKKMLSSPTLTSPYSGPVNLLKALNYHSRATMSGLFLPTASRFEAHQSDAPIQQLAQKYSSETTLGVTNGHAYKLTSAVVHHGDIYSGHFITYRRAPSTNGQRFPDRWVYTSDTTVRKASLSEVLQSSAYMLFYQKI